MREFIRAMGGELEITARFPGGSVSINRFEEGDKALSKPSRRKSKDTS
jgi:hypothetical protein